MKSLKSFIAVIIVLVCTALKLLCLFPLGNHWCPDSLYVLLSSPLIHLQSQRVLSILLLSTNLLFFLRLVHLFALGVSSICETADSCADGRKSFVQGIAYRIAEWCEKA